MLKKNKIKLFITSALILLPVLVGVFLWNELPEKVITHWNSQGIADGWSDKRTAVFIIPVLLLIFHLICVGITFFDPKNKNINNKILTVVLWICPIISLLCSSLMYTAALGIELRINVIMPMFIGLLFIIIGNYLPKCKQNHTVGIKVPWTLNDDENWNKTHRFAGTLWVIGGAIISITSFLENFTVFIIITFIMAIVPIIYSYLHYKSNKDDIKN